MKIVCKILALCSVVALCLTSCIEPSAIFNGDEVLARVGSRTYHASEARATVPKGLTGTDSLNYIEACVERWVVKQLKLQEAELMFSSSADDIERMVEEYRQSLLIRKIEKYYIDTEMRGEVTEKEIADYYDSHSGDFKKLSGPIVKGIIVEMPDTFRRKEQLLRLMNSSKQEDIRDFEALCTKYNLRLTKFSEWSDYTEFLGYLPLIRSVKYDGYLSKRNVQEIHHNNTYYCFRLTDVLMAGDMMPLYMARESILRILLNHRQGEVLHAHEDSIMRNALESGRAKIMLSKLDRE